MASTPQFVASANIGAVNLVNADGTNAETLFTPGSSGSRIDAIIASSDDTAARTLTISIVKSSVAYKIIQATVAPGTSMLPVMTTNVLDPSVLTWLDINEVGFILPSGVTLQVNVEAAVTSGKKIDIVVFGGDF